MVIYEHWMYVHLQGNTLNFFIMFSFNKKMAKQYIRQHVSSP